MGLKGESCDGEEDAIDANKRQNKFHLKMFLNCEYSTQRRVNEENILSQDGRIPVSRWLKSITAVY